MEIKVAILPSIKEMERLGLEYLQGQIAELQKSIDDEQKFVHILIDLFEEKVSINIFQKYPKNNIEQLNFLNIFFEALKKDIINRINFLEENSWQIDGN